MYLLTYPLRFSFICALVVMLSTTSTMAIENPAQQLGQANIDSKLGAPVDLQAIFTTSNGKVTTLKGILKPARPIIIVPAYYHCPRLCGLVLEGVQKLILALDLKLGEDYQVVTISFDTSDTPALASERQEQFESALKVRKGIEQSWPFLVGDKQNVTKIMDQIGFHYIEDKGEFAHGAGIILLTPDGEISQYFTGIEFPPRDVRLALVEASKGSIGTMLDHVLLFCFRFDHTKGKYTWAAFNFMRVGALITLFSLALVIYRMWRVEQFNGHNQV